MKSIIMSSDSIRALQAGRKTQTRRVIVPQPTNPRWNVIGRLGWDDGHGYKMRMPYKAGDVLYIKETWAKVSDWTTVDEEVGMPDGIIYKSDWEGEEHPKWHSPLHMPQAAARYFIEVTAVEVQRLQSITGLEAAEEGMFEPYACRSESGYEHEMEHQFKTAWNSLNAKRGYPWESNPWVWVICFKARSREKAERGGNNA